MKEGTGAHVCETSEVCRVFPVAYHVGPRMTRSPIVVDSNFVLFKGSSLCRCNTEETRHCCCNIALDSPIARRTVGNIEGDIERGPSRSCLHRNHALLRRLGVQNPPQIRIKRSGTSISRLVSSCCGLPGRVHRSPVPRSIRVRRHTLMPGTRYICIHVYVIPGGI